MDDIKVINEWILVRPDVRTEATTAAGIVIPAAVAAAAEPVERATVLQISPDVPALLRRETQDPDATLGYNVGDKILFYGKTGIPIADRTHMFLKYDGILATEVQHEKD